MCFSCQKVTELDGFQKDALTCASYFSHVKLSSVDSLNLYKFWQTASDRSLFLYHLHRTWGGKEGVSLVHHPSNLTKLLYSSRTYLGETNRKKFDSSAPRRVSVGSKQMSLYMYLFNEYKLWSYELTFPLWIHVCACINIIPVWKSCYCWCPISVQRKALGHSRHSLGAVCFSFLTHIPICILFIYFLSLPLDYKPNKGRVVMFTAHLLYQVRWLVCEYYFTIFVDCFSWCFRCDDHCRALTTLDSVWI